jgi:type III secretory pathway component EscU
MLDNAFAAASKLPVIEQNALARWMIEEIESDKKWDKLFAESEDALAQLAMEALDEEKSGLTTVLDPDKL